MIHEYGIATYDKNFGFSADWSACDIYVHDDSGLEVSLIGKVTHWSSLS